MPSTQFYIDLMAAKSAEEIVLSTFSSLAPEYTFEDVSSCRNYYHRGDIRAITPDGREVCIEVKQDGRIAATGNVLCEDKVHYYNSGMEKGNFHSDYEIYCVYSPQKRKLVVMDFDVLRRNYKSGTYKIIHHESQTTYAYLLSLDTIESLGGIITIIDCNTNTLTYEKSRNWTTQHTA